MDITIDLPENGIFISSGDITTPGKKTDILLVPGICKEERIYLLFAVTPFYKRDVLEVLTTFNKIVIIFRCFKKYMSIKRSVKSKLRV